MTGDTRPSLSTLFDRPEEHKAARERRAKELRARIAEAAPDLLEDLDLVKERMGARLVYLNLPGLQIGNEIPRGVKPSPPPPNEFARKRKKR